MVTAHKQNTHGLWGYGSVGQLLSVFLFNISAKSWVLRSSRGKHSLESWVLGKVDKNKH